MTDAGAGAGAASLASTLLSPELADGALVASQLAATLRPLLFDDHGLEAVAHASYSHANGFDRFVLSSAASGQKVRLHAWWPDQPRVAEHVHNHAWDFTSVVLSGSLRFELFEWADEGEEGWHYCSHPPVFDGTQHVYPFTPLGKRHIEARFSGSLNSGSVYRLDHQVLHRVDIATSDPVVTLMVHSPLRRMTSDIVAPAPISAADTVTAFDVPTTRKLLGQLVDLLS